MQFQEQFCVMKKPRSRDPCLVFLEFSNKHSEFSHDSILGLCFNNLCVLCTAYYPEGCRKFYRNYCCRKRERKESCLQSVQWAVDYRNRHEAKNDEEKVLESIVCDYGNH